MKHLQLSIVAWAICALSPAHAQNNDNHSIQTTIPEVALVDLESSTGTSIVLNTEAPSEAGRPVSFENAKDSSIWINYSSIVGSNSEPERTIYAKISVGHLPDGLRIMVKAQNDVGAGDGIMGVTAGGVRLGPAEKPIITGIGSAFTGNGAQKGHQLAYRLELRPSHTYAQIDFDQATTLTILYTIANN